MYNLHIRVRMDGQHFPRLGLRQDERIVEKAGCRDDRLLRYVGLQQDGASRVALPGVSRVPHGNIPIGRPAQAVFLTLMIAGAVAAVELRISGPS
jgi:hypothetical protein